MMILLPRGRASRRTLHFPITQHRQFWFRIRSVQQLRHVDNVALPFALLNRANVRIDVIYLMLPRWLRSFLDVFSLVLLVAFIAVVFWHSVNLFLENYKNDTRSITPLQARVWVPQGFWVFGMALFLLVGAVLFVLSMIALILWRHDRVATLIGSRSSEEEINSEVASLELGDLSLDQGTGRLPPGPDTDAGGER